MEAYHHHYIEKAFNPSTGKSICQFFSLKTFNGISQNSLFGTHLHTPFKHLYVYSSTHLYVYIYIHLHIHSSAHSYICTFIHLHIHTSTHTHTYIYTCTCTYIHQHIHIYTSTHLDTSTLSLFHTIYIFKMFTAHCLSFTYPCISLFSQTFPSIPLSLSLLELSTLSKFTHICIHSHKIYTMYTHLLYTFAHKIYTMYTHGHSKRIAWFVSFLYLMLLRKIYFVRLRLEMKINRRLKRISWKKELGIKMLKKIC